MRVIFVSGCYSGKTINETFENIMVARRVAAELWQEGYAVICPHTNSIFMDGENIENTREMFISGDLEILSRCDVIYMLPHFESSLGACEELRVAKEIGLEIIYGLKPAVLERTRGYYNKGNSPKKNSPENS